MLKCIPLGLVERALSHRNPLSASETMLQIYYSAVDQASHVASRRVDSTQFTGSRPAITEFVSCIIYMSS
jgi:hypothetical protein